MLGIMHGTQQKRAHDREMREMHERISQLQSGGHQQPQEQSYETGSYQGNPGDEQIHRAVSYALQHRDMEERKAKEAQQMQHVHRSYQDPFLTTVAEKPASFQLLHEAVLRSYGRSCRSCRRRAQRA